MSLEMLDNFRLDRFLTTLGKLFESPKSRFQRKLQNIKVLGAFFVSIAFFSLLKAGTSGSGAMVSAWTCQLPEAKSGFADMVCHLTGG